MKIAELGLDPDAIDLTAIEAVAAALRRTAGVLCPCTAPTLVRSVTRPLRGLVPDLQALKELTEDTLEAMVAHGDLLECRDIEQEDAVGGPTLLYAAPPGFVLRGSGTVILLGLPAGHAPVLPTDLEARVDHINHVRRITPSAGEDLRAELKQYGLLERSEQAWLHTPRSGTPEQLIAELDAALDVAGPSRDVPGLTLLDTAQPVRYYRGRWVDVRSQSGRFVGRRSQAYGADRWCYVEVDDGAPVRLVDLPLPVSRWRGCDDAWRLQMALDARNGQRQQFRMRPGPAGALVLELYSPVPMWARRRWDAIATPVPAQGCLFAYTVPEAEAPEERRFAHDMLWLAERS
ncbi:MAG: hypothetical protein AB7P99_05280 [Vicinamibacterales bacterium]